MSANHQPREPNPRDNGYPPELSFVVPHDATQDPIGVEERQAVGREFKTGVDLAFRAYAGTPYIEPDALGLPNNYLALGIDPAPGAEFGYIVEFTQNTDSEIQVKAEQAVAAESGHDLEDSEIALDGIDIEIIDGNGALTGLLSYREGNDGVIRRFTGRHSDPLDDDAIQDRFREVMDRGTGEHRQNMSLETQMGLNNQPVGLDEIRGLKTFVTQPGFKPIASDV